MQKLESSSASTAEPNPKIKCWPRLKTLPEREKIVALCITVPPSWRVCRLVPSCVKQTVNLYGSQPCFSRETHSLENSAR